MYTNSLNVLEIINRQLRTGNYHETYVKLIVKTPPTHFISFQNLIYGVYICTKRLAKDYDTL